MSQDYRNGKALQESLQSAIGAVILGKEETVRLLLTALFADGHVLLEDVPGTGKTKLARTLAKVIGGEFSRIQFTPDLLPADITGINMYDQRKGEFVLRRGPVFTNILLADEINRATPRTQAGLLECMEERQVTIDGTSFCPGEPFFVIATQNPLESSGVFPLPEAQLDRFLMKLSMGLPDKEEEVRILNAYQKEDPLTNVKEVLSLEELLKVRAIVNEVYVSDVILAYLAEIAAATRNHASIRQGISTRGTLNLLRASKAYAYLDGRSYVIPDDIRALAGPVLAHRMVMGFGTQSLQGAADALADVLSSIPVPTERFLP